MTGLRIMTGRACFDFGFHPTFFTLGIVSELNQKVLKVAIDNMKALSIGISYADWHRLLTFVRNRHWREYFLCCGETTSAGHSMPCIFERSGWH